MNNRQRIPQRIPQRIIAALVLFAVLLGIGLPQAEAHRSDQSYLIFDVGEELVVRMQMPFGDIQNALGIEIKGSPAAVEGAIARNEAVLVDYALDHVEIRGADGIWELTPVDTRRAEALTHVEIEFELAHSEDFQEFTVFFDPFFDEIEERDAIVLVANDLRRGIIESETDGLVRFTPDNRTNDVDLGSSQHLRNFTQSIQIGMDHIRTGPDHVLFILVLVIPSVLVLRDGWKPANNFRSTLWRLIKLMTVFTVAHSVTFSLAGLGLLPSPSSRLVETTIALSVVAAAFHNLRPIWQEREWIIAFFFGLFHGFGFASLVSDLEVSTTTQLISLVGRNIGIEFGQVIVVLLLFPMIFALRVFPIYRSIVIGLSLVLALIGAIWALERITDRQTTLTQRVDEWLEYPRVLIFVAIATAAAVAYRVIMQRNRPERMLPLA